MMIQPHSLMLNYSCLYRSAGHITGKSNNTSHGCLRGLSCLHLYKEEITSENKILEQGTRGEESYSQLLVEQKLGSDAYGQAGIGLCSCLHLDACLPGVRLYSELSSYKLSPVIFERLELTSRLLLQVACCVNFYLPLLSLISLQDLDIRHYCFTSL